MQHYCFLQQILGDSFSTNNCSIISRTIDNVEIIGERAHTHYPAHHKHRVNQIQLKIVFPWAFLLHCPHSIAQDPTTHKGKTFTIVWLNKNVITWHGTFTYWYRFIPSRNHGPNRQTHSTVRIQNVCQQLWCSCNWNSTLVCQFMQPALNNTKQVRVSKWCKKVQTYHWVLQVQYNFTKAGQWPSYSHQGMPRSSNYFLWLGNSLCIRLATA